MVEGVLELVLDGLVVVEEELEDVLDGLVVVEEDLEDVLDDLELEEELFFLQKRTDVASPVALKHATS